MKTVFMFSGQGSQHIGMGKSLYDNFPSAKKIFDTADEALGIPVSQICFEENERIHQTEYAQPAILTVSIAALSVLLESGIAASYTAGLSLGEYASYVYAGAIDFTDAVAIVRKRGKFMTEAVPLGEGAMSAIMGLNRSLVEEACLRAADCGVVSCANYNAPEQTVISGHKNAVVKASEIAKELGARQVVSLQVSGPFHSSLLAPAAEQLKGELNKITLHDMKIPVISNVTAEVVPTKESIIDALTKQVTSPVKWEDSIHTLRRMGADTFVEIGPGRTLCGFVKRIVKGVKVTNVEDMRSLEKALKELKKM